MPTSTSRRSFLGVAATAGFALARLGADAPPAVASGSINQDEFLENGAGRFAVDIPGCGVASGSIQSVQVEDITIDMRETTTGLDVEYRTFAPGDVHVGPVTITVADDT